MSPSIRARPLAPLFCSLPLAACGRTTDPPCSPGPLPTLRLATGNPVARRMRQAAHAVVETLRRDPPAAFLMPKPAVAASHSEWLIETDQASVFAFADCWALKGFTPCAGR